ncbi:Fpg/Nei family DNA glycosylase [Gorillibacterium sp. sgz5001074]|uniref:Fpg/Nei family DNA glycosylase n=1 Tax=Gorillibacterium sp. sgz5001074 TaxID=3446695 RepID=UPI003F67EA2D
MPELPEMENYRRLLTPRMVGKRITRVTVTREKSVNVDAAAFVDRVAGRTVTDITRRAKHLLFHLDGDQALLLHLMLGGVLFWGTEQEKPERTVQVELQLGEASLHFIGLRLGYLHLYPTAEVDDVLAKLGPEPMSPSFGEADFRLALGRRRGYLKPVLVDQGVLSGIGNCYSDEICFDAGILPQTKLENLQEADWSRLYRSMRSTLAEAIAHGGYMDLPLFKGDALTGGFDARCRVYDREGEPCVRCGALIQRVDFASKKSYSCPGCQR